jgi:glutaconyl-CoA/methylmalonyl-CoA decarboxylase subunit gamma
MKMRVKVGDQIFEVEIEDLNARPILARVDCDTFEVWPEEEAAPVRPDASEVKPAVPAAPRAAAPVPANGNGSSAGRRMVTAPIPGKIIGVSVKAGDTVVVAQELVTLEAMKMKNAIRATRAGTIAIIHVGVGDTVSHGQPLVEFAD